MLPYGKNRKFGYNYKDNHPKPGYVNWWEYELGDVNKKKERQEAKKEITKIIRDEEITKTGTEKS